MQTLGKLQASTEEGEQLKQRVADLTKEVRELKDSNEERMQRIDRVADNYIRLRDSTRNLRRRVDHFTHLPIGYNARQRKRKAVSLLAKHGGARKRRVRTTK